MVLLLASRSAQLVCCFLESFVCASRIGFSLSDFCYCLSTWSGLHFSLPFISTACRSESSLLFLVASCSALGFQPICSSVGEAKAVPSQILPLEHCLLRIELPRETGRCRFSMYLAPGFYLPEILLCAKDFLCLCASLVLAVCLIGYAID
jgi:hypothetical protein